MKTNLCIKITIIYFLLCFLSVASILYGAYNNNFRELFEFGNIIIAFWLVNPMGLVVPIICMIGSDKKGVYIICMIINIISWVVAGSIIGSIR